MGSLEIFFLDFQSLLIAQDNKLCIHMRAVGKMVLFFSSFLSKKEFARGDLPISQKEISFALQKRHVEEFKWAPYFDS